MLLMCIRLQDNYVIKEWRKLRKRKGFSANEDVANFLLRWFLVDSSSKTPLECQKCHKPLTVFCQTCSSPLSVNAENTKTDSKTITSFRKGRRNIPPEESERQQLLESDSVKEVNAAVIIDSNHQTSELSGLVVVNDGSFIVSDDQFDDTNNVGCGDSKSKPRNQEFAAGDSEATVNVIDGDGQPNQKQKSYCAFCCLDFSWAEYCSHMVIHKDLIVTDENKRLKCKACSKTFISFRDVCFHVKIASDQKECGVCLQNFSLRCELRKHQLIHQREVHHYCKWCQKPMVELTNRAFRKHIKEHREKEKNGKKSTNVAMCAICGKIFKKISHLDEHIKCVHSNNRPFACTWPGCTHTFKTKGTLMQHSAFHGEKCETCELCGKMFHRMLDLKVHMQDHFGKKFECEKCHHRFKKQSHLKEHFEGVHLGLRRFPCTSCDKKFATKGTMQQHIQVIHMGVQPFKCPECGMALKTRSGLKKHMVRHGKKKPYQCSECGLAFSGSSTLKRHRLNKHKNSVYICTVCGIAFSIPPSLSFHMRMFHNEVDYDEEPVASFVLNKQETGSLTGDRLLQETNHVSGDRQCCGKKLNDMVEKS